MTPNMYVACMMTFSAILYCIKMLLDWAKDKMQSHAHIIAAGGHVETREEFLERENKRLLQENAALAIEASKREYR